MSINELLTLIGGIMLTIISYFLRSTMQDLKDTKNMAYDTKSQLDLLRLDHSNKLDSMSEKFDELKSALKDLTKEVTTLSKIMANK